MTPSPAPILPSLSVLRLGSNLLTSLPDGSFSACPALSELYLDNNSLRSLRDRTFAGLSKLEVRRSQRLQGGESGQVHVSRRFRKPTVGKVTHEGHQQVRLTNMYLCC